MTRTLIAHGATAATHTAKGSLCALTCTATVTTSDHVDTATADSALFVDPAHSNLHLKKGAAVINQGGDTPAAGAKDVDGQARLVGAKTDLGADEYDDTTTVTPTLTATPTAPASGGSVAFTAHAAPDAATSSGVKNYVITFGDGATATTTTGAASHSYAAAGTFHATAVAVGNSGALSPKSAAVTIVVGGGGNGGGNGNSSAAPTVQITSPKNGKVLKLTKTVTKTIRRGHRKVKKKLKVPNLPVLRGTASDPDGVTSVKLALIFLGKSKTLPSGGSCSAFDGGKSFKKVSCVSSPFFSATITDFNWRFKFSKKAKLKKGYYALLGRATDNVGHATTAFSVAAGTSSVFRLK